MQVFFFYTIVETVQLQKNTNTYFEFSLLLHPFMGEVLFCIGIFSMKILGTTIFGWYHYFLDLKFYVL